MMEYADIMMRLFYRSLTKTILMDMKFLKRFVRGQMIPM
ncbi:hypothetical protein CU003_2153 [Enterococcus faecium]|nr:hypothetical protein [Enterococcus faecium]